MKKLSVFLSALLILSLTQVQAQVSKFSAGLVTTHFSDDNSVSPVANFDNPFGMGVLVGYQFEQDAALSLTTEYLSADIKNTNVTESILRANLSVFVFPVQMEYFNAYVSAGAVFNFINRDYENHKDVNVTKLQSRFGAGVDIPVVHNINFNIDFAFYSTELEYTGWAQSFGIRYAL